MKYVQNKNGKFAVGNEEVRFKGIGIGSWLNLEHYMIGMPTPDCMIRDSFEKVYGVENAEKFWDNYVYNFIQREDIALIKKSGINLLRVPFNYRLLIDDNKEGWKESGFAYLTYLLDLCDEYEIYVLLDLHTAPGGQNPDWHSDNRTGISQFWEFRLFRRQITRLWGEIARRYGGREYLFGYDLLNEPAMCGWEVLNEFYHETIAEIRRYDSCHLIALGGEHFAMEFGGLEQFEDSQICIGFHFYPVCWYPRLSEPDCTRKEFNGLFRKVLQEILEQCKKFNKPCFCGEFGFERGTEEPAVMYTRMEDTIKLFEEYGLSWVIWTYKDLGDMGLTTAAENSKWMKFAEDTGSSWSQDKEKAEAAEVLALCRKLRYPIMQEEMEYKLSFRVRAILYELQAVYILQAELKKIPWEEMKEYPEDFKLKNCKIDETFLDILRRCSGV
ncbi:MAG: cellulase family glycosylhydrolase [Lachnospiraceae bacterium]|nr:cellulase family glycosylhydrolase [Lachnospiraceae bacterium]